MNVRQAVAPPGMRAPQSPHATVVTESSRTGRPRSRSTGTDTFVRACAGIGALGILASLLPGTRAQHPALAPIPAGTAEECGVQGLQLVTTCGLAALNAIGLGVGPAGLAGAAALPLSTANCIWAIRRACMRLCLPYDSVWCT